MPTTNSSAAGAHPIELALAAMLTVAQALLPLIAAAIALALTIAGWRPTRADAPIEPTAVQTHQAPFGPTPSAPVSAMPEIPTSGLPAPSGPLVHPLHQLFAKLPTAELRAACTTAGRRPGRSRTTALAALLA